MHMRVPSDTTGWPESENPSTCYFCCYHCCNHDEEWVWEDYFIGNSCQIPHVKLNRQVVIAIKMMLQIAIKKKPLEPKREEERSFLPEGEKYVQGPIITSHSTKLSD
jgi:hypothetical protein